ncbi:VTT domain-containing protein [Candidatus Kaiserbacteria bacterium]|nr:VTT domain-containing protein [Candidatus Kaiserbacteria bacterium]
MRNIKTALYFLIAMGVLIGGWYLLDLPPDYELKRMIGDAFQTYGPIVIYLGSLLEGLLFIGFYFPGSLVIFLSVALAGSPLAAVKAVVFVTLGLYTAYIIDYLLGRYGWYRLLTRFGLGESINETRERLEARGWRYILATFWNPAFSALTATAAGILHLPLRSFALMALGALILWNTFWGVLVYSLGEAALTIVGFKFVIIAAVLWLLYEIVRAVITHRRESRGE